MAAFRDEGITSSTSGSSSSVKDHSNAVLVLCEPDSSLGDAERRRPSGAASSVALRPRALPLSDSLLCSVGDVGGDEPGDGRCFGGSAGRRSGVADTSVVTGARVSSVAPVRCLLWPYDDAVEAKLAWVERGAEHVLCSMIGRTSRRDMTTSLLVRAEWDRDDRRVARSACKMGWVSVGGAAGAMSSAGDGLADTLRFQGRRRVGVSDGPGAKHLDRSMAHSRGAIG